MRKSFKKALSLFMTAAMAVSLGSGFSTAVVPTEADAEDVVYHAALGLQTGDSWIFRDSIQGSENSYSKTVEGGKDQTTYTLASSAVTTQTQATGEKVKTFTYDYSKHLLKAGATALNGKQYYPGTYDVAITDADLDYNGKTYSIKIDGLDKMNGEDYALFQNDTETGFNMLFLSTDIPLAENEAAFSNIEIYFDGQLVHTMSKNYQKHDETEYHELMFINIYGANSTNDNPATDKDKFTYTMPTKSIEVKFTLNGVKSLPTQVTNADGSVTTSGAIASAPAVTTPGAADDNATSLAKGKTFKAGNFTYKVTKAAKKSGKATVAVTGVKKSALKKNSLTVPATVKKSNFKYKVTSINSKAFSKTKKLKKVTLGKNVTTINKNAFAKCTKLTSLKANAKLKKVAKGAFKGCKKKIKVSGKSKKANVKLLKKSGYKKFK